MLRIWSLPATGGPRAQGLGFRVKQTPKYYNSPCCKEPSGSTPRSLIRWLGKVLRVITKSLSVPELSTFPVELFSRCLPIGNGGMDHYGSPRMIRNKLVVSILDSLLETSKFCKTPKVPKAQKRSYRRELYQGAKNASLL